MEVDSDSSSGSVTITGPIPEYLELRKRPMRTSVPARNGHPNKRNELVVMDIIQDEKVEKIRQLEDFVNATANISRNGHNKDDDVDTWSGSETKSIKGSGKRDLASKYLKKIKTLQQNKRRQETRISRLTKEVRTLRDKVSVQAAYLDVLCGMLGDEMKEKFKDRQGMGILGNTKMDDDHLDDIAAVERGENGVWPTGDGGKDKTSVSDAALKEKELEFYCVEDLDEVEENGMSHAGSSEDLKEATEVKADTMESKVLGREREMAEPSTSYGMIGNRTGKANEISALTIAVGKPDPIHRMCNTFSQANGNHMGGNIGQGRIHHGVFGALSDRRLCEFEGQVGESVFARVPSEIAQEPNLYGDMRVQLAYGNTQREPMPPVISYGMVMENHGLNLLPAVHPTMDDPLNIGSDDASSFGPLIITTSLDPLNLSSNPSSANRKKILRKTASSQDPLNIGSDDTLIDDPQELPDGVDPIGSDQSTALLISVPGSTETPPQGVSDLTEMPHQPMVTEATSTPQPTITSPGMHATEMHPVRSPTSRPHSGNDSNHLSLHSDSQGTRPELSMPLLSDITVQSDVEHQDDDCGNISHPQEIVDHLINNISYDLSPDLRLE